MNVYWGSDTSGWVLEVRDAAAGTVTWCCLDGALRKGWHRCHTATTVSRGATICGHTRELDLASEELGKVLRGGDI